MKKLIIEVALFRFGVRRFEDRVNALAEKGWKIDGFVVERKWFHFICWALMENTAT